MTTNSIFNYKKEINRYKYYYQRLQVFYQTPVTRVSAAVLFTISTIVFFAIFAIRPTLQTISQLLKKIDDQKKVLTQAEAKSASLATAQQQLDLFQPLLPTLELSIPPTYAIQILLRDLESTAGNLGIPLSNLKISDLEYPTPAIDTNTVQELSFTISINASYPLIKQFISQVLLLPRLITIDSISISTPKENFQSSFSDNVLNGNIKCRTFYLTQMENQL